jgi:hypothetical protein
VKPTRLPWPVRSVINRTRFGLQLLAIEGWKLVAGWKAWEETLNVFLRKPRPLDISPVGRVGIKSVWVLPIGGDRKPRQFAASGGSAKFSPDGKWVAYCSDESGQPEVYVQSWPGPGPKIQISAEGRTDPVWSPDGKEVFYRNGTKMMAVAVELRPCSAPASRRCSGVATTRSA